MTCTQQHFLQVSLACGFFKSIITYSNFSSSHWCHFLVDFSKVLWHANSNTFYRSLSCGFFFLSIRIVCKQQHFLQMSLACGFLKTIMTCKEQHFFESIMTCKQHFFKLLLIPLSCGFSPSPDWCVTLTDRELSKCNTKTSQTKSKSSRNLQYFSFLFLFFNNSNKRKQITKGHC